MKFGRLVVDVYLSSKAPRFDIQNDFWWLGCGEFVSFEALLLTTIPARCHGVARMLNAPPLQVPSAWVVPPSFLGMAGEVLLV
jgi:hypothetical protein